ncbi:hypothetical protein FQR65_LT17319 [Abscondita terminalis]|nr:hypothetical protein FQR65_LT17319 [Abscondita terminalis]
MKITSIITNPVNCFTSIDSYFRADYQMKTSVRIIEVPFYIRDIRNVNINITTSLIHHDLDMIKAEMLDSPLKKNKLEDFAHLSFNMQQLYTAAALDPMYLQYLHDIQANRHMSAFKPFPTSGAKEAKIRMGIGRYSADPPVLQNPERVVPLSESKRFEQSYQPNVALAPPIPKKHRYGRTNETVNRKEIHIKEELPVSNETSVIKNEIDTRKKYDNNITIMHCTSGNLSRYNSEIELSTDTDDSASEASEKQSDMLKIEEALKDIDVEIKNRILELVRNIAKEHDIAMQECRNKDNKITELELRISQLETGQKVGNLLCNGFVAKHSSVTGNDIFEPIVKQEGEINSSTLNSILRDDVNSDEKGDATETLEIPAITPSTSE